MKGKARILYKMNPTQPITTPSVGIFYTKSDQKGRSEQLARSLALPIITDSTGYDFVLSFLHDRLSLSLPNNPSHKGQIYAEFVKGAAGYRRKHTKKEMLRKAIGFREKQPPVVLDATGGMGKDSFLMASYGCRVHVLERNPVVAALLQDGLRRASEHPDTSGIAARVHLSVRDSFTFLRGLTGAEKKYDVIYLDPMFPERSKSALVKKEMQILQKLQKLIGLENDAEQILAPALGAASKRVVVKRPKSAPFLIGPKPSHSISGKTTRFDVYMI